jgi:hypothetical protein
MSPPPRDQSLHAMRKEGPTLPHQLWRGQPGTRMTPQLPPPSMSQRRHITIDPKMTNRRTLVRMQIQDHLSHREARIMLRMTKTPRLMLLQLHHQMEMLITDPPFLLLLLLPLLDPTRGEERKTIGINQTLIRHLTMPMHQTLRKGALRNLSQLHEILNQQAAGESPASVLSPVSRL